CDVLALLANAGTGLVWPRVLGTAQHNGHIVRLLAWVPGRPMSESSPYSPGLLRSLGQALANMDLALAGFDHPAAHRAFHCALRQAAQARSYLTLHPADRVHLVAPIFDRWLRIEWSALPHSVIHGDANDYNVLTADGRVTSILDFGDMVWSATV